MSSLGEGSTYMEAVAYKVATVALVVAAVAMAVPLGKRWW